MSYREVKHEVGVIKSHFDRNLMIMNP